MSCYHHLTIEERHPGPYRATAAQKRYIANRKRCVRPKLLSDFELHRLVHFLLGNFWWSPEQIYNRLSEEGTAHISASTIYRALENGMLQDTLRYYLRIKYRKHEKTKSHTDFASRNPYLYNLKPQTCDPNPAIGKAIQYAVVVKPTLL